MKNIYDSKKGVVELTDLNEAFIYVNEREIEVDENEGMKEMILNAGGDYEPKYVKKYEYDVELIKLDDYSEAGALEKVRSMKLAEISAYDRSSNVNSFYLKGIKAWLDKDTRVGLMNSTQITKNIGRLKTTLWLGITELEINCDKAIQLLSALEIYALDCFNVTAAHTKNVMSMNSIEDIYNYDYKKGYPEKLNLSTTV